MLPLLLLPAAMAIAALGNKIDKMNAERRELERREDKGITIYKDCNIHYDLSRHVTINNYYNCTFNKYENCIFGMPDDSDDDEYLRAVERGREQWLKRPI